MVANMYEFDSEWRGAEEMGEWDGWWGGPGGLVSLGWSRRLSFSDCLRFCLYDL